MYGCILDFDFRSIRRSYTCSSKATIMDERLGRDTLAFLGRFPIQTCPTLHWPHKQRWMRVFRRFCEFQLCIRWGEGGEGGTTARKFRKGSTILWGNPKNYRKYKYCFTVPRTFVHDCITLCSFKQLLQENEENCGKHILVVSYREIVNYSPPPHPPSRAPSTPSTPI